MTSTLATDRPEQVARLARIAHRAATAYGRPDLADRVELAAQRLDASSLGVVVLGEFKTGKSSLVNALVGAAICPVDADLATAVATVVRHADAPAARVIRAATDGGPGEATEVDPRQIAAAIIGEADAAAVEVELPSPLLSAGIMIVDTPGVGGLDARHLAQSLGVLATADVVLFVADGANELGGPALDLLVQVCGLVPSVVLVLTKADLHHHIDRVMALDREHLAGAGLDVDLVVTAAELHDLGVRHGDATLVDESGITVLGDHLRSLRTGNGDRAAGATLAAIDDVTAQLRAVFEAELAALSQTPAPVAAPERAAPGPGWQQLLLDEITDLTADLDHDLRRRTRELAHEAEETLTEGDPTDLWPEVAAWLEERAATDVVATFTALRDRTTAIAHRVAERFEQTDGAGSPIDPAAMDDLARQVLTTLPARATLAADGAGKATSGLNAFRSTFYGFSMFSSVAALVGVAAAPAALVLGLAIGGKALRDERGKGRQQRRAQAKAAVRTYLDEVTFVTGKESRDALRTAQRTLRDHFTTLAAEQQRSQSEAAAAARRAAAADGEARERRRRDVEAEIGRLDALARQAAALR